MATKRMSAWRRAARLSLRAALWLTAAVAICLGVLRSRADLQLQAARELRLRGFELGYEPVAPWIDRVQGLSDVSQLSFHFTHCSTFVRIPDGNDEDGAAELIAHLRSVKEVEIQVWGGCGNSYFSAHDAAQKMQLQLPNVKITVKGYAIPIVG